MVDPNGKKEMDGNQSIRKQTEGVGRSGTGENLGEKTSRRSEIGVEKADGIRKKRESPSREVGRRVRIQRIGGEVGVGSEVEENGENGRWGMEENQKEAESGRSKRPKKTKKESGRPNAPTRHPRVDGTSGESGNGISSSKR